MKNIDLELNNLCIESKYTNNNNQVLRLFLDENENIIFKIYFFPDYEGVEEIIKEQVFTIKSTLTDEIYYCFYGSNMMRHSEIKYEEDGEPIIEYEYLHVYFINLYQNENLKIKFKEKNNKIIEKNLIQTHESLSKIPRELILYNLEMCPEYTYHFFDNQSRREFIKEHYGNDRILNAYDLLIPNAYRADYFKLLSLYVLGGVYMDHKCVLMYDLDEIVPYDKEYFLVSNADVSEKSISNNFMMFKKGHHILKYLIDKFTEKVELKMWTGNDFFEFGSNFFKDNCDFKDEYNEFLLCDSKNETIFKLDQESEPSKKILLYNSYQNYYTINLQEEFHYAKMYYNGFVFYKNMYETEDYKFYIWNHWYSDDFEFDIRNNNLYVFRVDNHEGFEYYHRVKIVDKNLNKEKQVDIGVSNTPTKIIYNVF